MAGVGFVNAVCVQTRSRSTSRSRPQTDDAKRVNVGSAIVHLVQSVVTEPASLVVDSETGSQFRALGKRTGQLQAHCVSVGEMARKPGSFDTLFLHGVMGSTFSWRRVQAKMSKVFGGRSVSFDRPPYGLSARPHRIQWKLSKGRRNPYSLEFGTDMALDVMDSFDSTKAVLVAHSLGAAVAISMALKHPERVQGLVLIAPAPRLTGSKIRLPRFVRILLFIPVLASLLFFVVMGRTATCPVSFKRSMGRYFYDLQKVDMDELFYGYTRPMRHSGWVRAAVDGLRCLREFDCTKDASQLKIPVLVIAAGEDKVIPFGEIEALAKEIPDAELQIMPHCGHNPHEESPDEVMRIVEKWLRRVRTSL